MKLFGWLKHKPEAVPAPKKRSSIFSTDIDGDQLGQIEWENVLTKSFQRTPGQFQAVDRAGNKIEGKISNAAPGGAIGQFAMDAPSDGNVLSMKPIIQPLDLLPQAQLFWYAAHGFIGYQICSMVAQHWMVDKICTTPARDAMRHGYELATEDGEKVNPKVLAFIRKKDKEFGIKQNAVEFARFNRIFGIRLALFLVDTKDESYYLLPFDPEKVKPGSYRGMAQIDPYWITPELDFEAAANPASVNFYEPTWWRVNGQRIHRTHFVLIRNGKVSDVLKPSYYYGGVSIPQKIAERVYAAERTANEAPQLALTKRVTFFKVDITQALANLNEFLQKINFFNQMRDNYGTKIGGLDEEYEQFDTSLADFNEVMMGQYTVACAAGDCPTTKIMGTSPKGGLGSEGDYDADSYHQFLESMQEHDMQPLIERHHLMLMHSEVHSKFKGLPMDWQPAIHWNPVDAPDAKKQAEINEFKSRTGNNLVNSGAIDGVDERTRLDNDKTSGYNGLADREPEIADDTEEGAEGDIKSDKPEPNEST